MKAKDVEKFLKLAQEKFDLAELGDDFTKFEAKMKKEISKPKKVKIKDFERFEVLGLDALGKLSKDLKNASLTLNRAEIRYLVDLYYQIQKYRTAMSKQADSMQEEPHELFDHFKNQAYTIEDQIKVAMRTFTENHPVGKWMLSNKGVGEITAAGLIAYIDIERARTAGAIWSYAGMDPNREWLGREKSEKIVSEVIEKHAEGKKRPVITDMMLAEISILTGWKTSYLRESSINDKGKISKDALVKAVSKIPYNASFKVLCWKIGQNFLKQKNKKDAFYAQLIQPRLDYENKKNLLLDYKDQAEKKLRECKIKSEVVLPFYEKGMLPPGHIQQRALNHAVKIFLSHVHHVMYCHHYKELPPVPFAIAHMGHTDMIEVPNLEHFDNEVK